MSASRRLAQCSTHRVRLGSCRLGCLGSRLYAAAAAQAKRRPVSAPVSFGQPANASKTLDRVIERPPHLDPNARDARRGPAPSFFGSQNFPNRDTRRPPQGGGRPAFPQLNTRQQPQNRVPGRAGPAFTFNLPNRGSRDPKQATVQINTSKVLPARKPWNEPKQSSGETSKPATRQVPTDDFSEALLDGSIWKRRAATEVVEETYIDPNDRHRARKIKELELKKKKRETAEAMQQAQPQVEIKRVAKLGAVQKLRDVYLPKLITVENLANRLGAKLANLQDALYQAGIDDVSYDQLLNAEDAALVAPDFKCNVIINEEAAFDIVAPPEPADRKSLPTRPPVVTIMGHVDHGKTTLLDKLRFASVAQGEAGGITQHIGAFSIPVSSLSTSKDKTDKRSITFLDTPGHAAFSAMRARGARCTDIVVLVVAADDGVMPQTKEVIELVKQDQGKVSLVVAINKVDKPEADVDRVKRMLLAEGVQLEGFGGDVPVVEVSGATGHGLHELVETISIVSEMNDLRASDQGAAVGYVLESKKSKGHGPVATVLLLRGQLTPGAHLIAGTSQCRIRQLIDSNGAIVKSIKPGTAVTVSGWKELPSAGDQVLQANSESELKRAITNRKREQEESEVLDEVDAINQKRRQERQRRLEVVAEMKALGDHATQPTTQLFKEETSKQDGGCKELKLLVKADVSGSAEAIEGALAGIGNHIAKATVVHSSVGDVTEGDVAMAKAMEGVVVAFNVKTPKSTLQAAITQGVPVLQSDIIYRLMEDVRNKVIDLLPKIIETRVVGEATVQQDFAIDLGRKKVLKVAGCRVLNGTMTMGGSARLVRNGLTIHEGLVETLRHEKKPANEVRKGMECGLSIAGFTTEFKPGDTVQLYTTIEKPGIL